MLPHVPSTVLHWPYLSSWSGGVCIIEQFGWLVNSQTHPLAVWLMSIFSNTQSPGGMGLILWRCSVQGGSGEVRVL